MNSLFSSVYIIWHINEIVFFLQNIFLPTTFFIQIKLNNFFLYQSQTSNGVKFEYLNTSAQMFCY